MVVIPRRAILLSHEGISQLYTIWFLYDRLWKDCLDVREDGVWLNYRPAKSDTPHLMADAFEKYGLLGGNLNKFLAGVRRRVGPERVNGFLPYTDERLRAMLAGMASDIQEMRPFLVKSFKPQKTIIPLGDGLVVAWRWTVRFGIANLVVGESEAEVLRYVESQHSAMDILVDHDGLLFESTKPWVTADESPPCEDMRPLALNCYIVGLFHERLYSFYDRIDFERIRARDCCEAATSPEEGQEALALSCQDLARKDGVEDEECPPPFAPRRRPIPSVRLQRLLSLLVDRFGCEIRQGHGSEITVYRRGGKKWILGVHKRNAPVPSEVVGNLLKRVGIGLEEWLSVVYL